MIEQTFFPSNFIGRDGFKWWLGQVADPTSSGWSKTATLEEKEDCQYYRVKVRILGYHPPPPDLNDEDLPWAHVLVPTGQGSGMNGIGDLHNIQGGETVLGFFMDGDDCQQPVIFGSFYRQTFQKAKSLSEGESYAFKAYNPKKEGTNLHLVKKKEDEKSGGKNLATGEETDAGTPEQATKNGVPVPGKTKADSAFVQPTLDPITTPNPCGNDDISRITKFITEFMNRMRQIQQFQELYIDPVLQEVVSLDSEIKLLAKKMLGVISGLVTKARDFVLSKVGTAINTFVGTIIPKSLHPETGQATRTILDLIWCLFEKLLDILLDLILEILFGLINKLFDIVKCTVDNILSSIFNEISKWIDENLSPILQQINDVIGGALGSIGNVVSQALEYAGIVLNIIQSCDIVPCPTPSTWDPGEGIKFTTFDDWGAVLDNLGSEDFGECDNSLICNSKIVFSGGGGFGAIADLIIDAADGGIIGADIVDGGSGYVDSPFVSIEDNCGGSGGNIIAIIDDGGSVTDLIIDDPGGGYTDGGDGKDDGDDGSGDCYKSIQNNNLGNIPITSPDYWVKVNCSDSPTKPPLWDELVTYPKDKIVRWKRSGSPNPRTKCGFIFDVYVKKTGFNYSSTDTITVLNCDGQPSKATVMEIVTGPINGIVKVKVKTSEIFCGCKPTIQINTSTGEGAVLIPIMRYRGGKPVDPDSTGPISVIDCVKK